MGTQAGGPQDGNGAIGGGGGGARRPAVTRDGRLSTSPQMLVHEPSSPPHKDPAPNKGDGPHAGGGHGAGGGQYTGAGAG